MTQTRDKMGRFAPKAKKYKGHMGAMWGNGILLTQACTNDGCAGFCGRTHQGEA